jgi:hypothetical protein
MRIALGASIQQSYLSRDMAQSTPGYWYLNPKPPAGRLGGWRQQFTDLAVARLVQYPIGFGLAAESHLRLCNSMVCAAAAKDPAVTLWSAPDTYLRFATSRSMVAPSVWRH